MRDAKPAFSRRTITPKCYPLIGYREAQGLSLRHSSPWTEHQRESTTSQLPRSLESASILLSTMLMMYTNPLASPLAANRTSHLQRSFLTPRRPHGHLDCDDDPHIRLQFTRTYPSGKQLAPNIITAVARDTVRLCSDTMAVRMTYWIACL